MASKEDDIRVEEAVYQVRLGEEDFIGEECEYDDDVFLEASQSGSTAADLLDGLHALSARLSALVLDGRRLGRDLASVREDFASVERRLDRLGGDAEDTRREVRDAGVLEDLIRLMSYNGAGKVPEGVYITTVQPKRKYRGFDDSETS